MFKHSVILLLLTVITACANRSTNLTQMNTDIRHYITANDMTAVDRVTSFRFHGWNSISDEFLVLTSSPKRKYLIELLGYCSDIRWAHTIKLERSMDSSLHAKFDSIGIPGQPALNCRIEKIYPITSEQEDVIFAIKNPPEEETSNQ
ncbi:DUF6491 family protein [Thalassotalea sp. PP2-459]|uniref:DUF6491 family protein n=1 Tax=Thalassotalea sp. PP2-459 TaxID=1742724 RepID=UPI00094293D1|nr:DUF6491 family protein [Thalassotalea sp. PP2-459]OKY26645.1 hypothetical protein BI291_01200 [Thalassotalea sp. PP2-459]